MGTFPSWASVPTTHPHTHTHHTHYTHCTHTYTTHSAFQVGLLKEDAGAAGYIATGCFHAPGASCDGSCYAHPPTPHCLNQPWHSWQWAVTCTWRSPSWRPWLLYIGCGTLRPRGTHLLPPGHAFQRIMACFLSMTRTPATFPPSLPVVLACESRASLRFTWRAIILMCHFFGATHSPSLFHHPSWRSRGGGLEELVDHSPEEEASIQRQDMGSDDRTTSLEDSRWARG